MPYTIKSIEGQEPTETPPIESPRIINQVNIEYPNQEEQETTEEQKPIQEKIPEKKFTIKSIPEKEQSSLESLERYGAQAAKAATYYGVSKIPGGGKAILASEGTKMLMGTMGPSPEDIAMLKENFESRGLPWGKENEQAIQSGYEQAQSLIPSISSAFEQAEKRGVPVEAKTPRQKAVSVVLDTISGSGKGALKVLGGGVALGLYHGLQNAGVPEPIAGNIARVVGLITGQNPEGFIPAQATEEKLVTTPDGTPPSGTPPPIPPKFTYQKPETPPSVEKAEPKSAFEFSEKGLEIQRKAHEIEQKRAEIKHEKETPAIEKIKPEPLQVSKKPIESAQVREGHQVVKSLAEQKLGESGRNFIVKAPSEPTTPIERVGSKVGYTPRDEKIAGERIKQIFLDTKEHDYRIASDLYEKARKLNKNIYATREEAYNKTKKLIDEANETYKGTEDISLVREGEKLLKKLGAEDENGNIVLYHVSNDTLIDAAQAFRDYVKTKYPHQGKQNIFYKMIDIAEDAILDTAKANPSAYKSYLEAKNYYKNHMDKFTNPSLENFLNNLNKKPIALYNTAKDKDIYNILGPILEESEKNLPVIPGKPTSGMEGKLYSNALKKDIVEETLKPFLNKLKPGESLTPDQIRRAEEALRSIGIKLSKQEYDSIVKEIRSFGKKEGATLFPERKVSKEGKKPSFAKEEFRLEGKTPEQYHKDIQTVSGLRKERESLKSSPGLRKAFEEKVVREAAIYELHNGKIKGPESTRSMETVLQNVDNLKWFEEAVGKDVVDGWKKGIAEWKKYGDDVKFYEARQKDYSSQLKKYDNEIKALKRKSERDITAQQKKITKEQELETIRKRDNYILYVQEATNLGLDWTVPFVPGPIKRFVSRKVAETTADTVFKKSTVPSSSK